ncbi:purine-nucleoside phosphorylase [Schaalia sp. lx-260]|uniref:purine-nucleoside phosphorylase n=1 Tax=Schaalia sp. lx-260 TaxID=2899082 RepID=UPI001E4C8C6C|nr:purine-nucleoside phosphorylase [Schaalia sp. lx-260]MCD4549071.1 purine-nucleoside phosphorylase [Schaalia sp. lx-260]
MSDLVHTPDIRVSSSRDNGPAPLSDTNPFEVAEAAARSLRSRTGIEHYDIALVLGSGWAEATQLLGEVVASIPARQIPGFRAPAVPGHQPCLISVKITGTDRYALVLGARTHYYEGHGVRAVAHAVRTAAACGAGTLILTNSCGSVRPEWGPGSVVLLRDHINLTGASPIEGAHFVDLTDLYSQRLRDIAHRVNPDLPEGVYTQFCGPHYETPAEVRMAGILGGDLVGMSTALEAIAARQSGMEVMALSLVTNLAAGVGSTPLSHEEVIEAGRESTERISTLLAGIVHRIATENC